MIRELTSEVKSFSSNDLLVNIDPLKTFLIEQAESSFSIPFDREIKKSYTSSMLYFRESGSHILCLTKGLIEWEIKGKKISTPILVFPLSYKRNKVKNTLECTLNDEDFFLNPYLSIVLQNDFDLKPNGIPFLSQDWSLIQETLNNLGFSTNIKEDNYLGNFHHHRFEILKDLEELQELSTMSPNLMELLHSEISQHYENIPLSSRQLFAADNDQLTVYKELTEKNLVVHGPPGTGKSQVLANLIGKTQYEGLSTLVVSEKRAALNVLQTKLSEFGLDQFIFMPTAEKSTHSVLQSMKASWKLLEEHQPLSSLHLDLSSRLLDSLQLKLNLLTRDDLIGGVSFDTYHKLSKGLDLSEVEYNGHTASIAEFIVKKDILQNICKLGIKDLIHILPQNLISGQAFLTLDQNVKTLEKRYAQLRENFQFETTGELAVLMKKASFCQMMANEQHQAYFKVLNPNTSLRSKFNRHHNALAKVNKGIELLADQSRNWKTEPSREEAMGLLENMDKSSFLIKLKVKRRLNQLLKSTFVPQKEALEKWIKYCDLLIEKNNVEKDLLAIGIANERELDWVNAIQHKLNREDWKDWKDRSASENNLLASKNAELHILYQNLRTFFKIDDSYNLDDIFDKFNRNFSLLLEKREDLTNLSDLLYKQIGTCKNIEAIENQVLKSNWIRFIGQFSTFKQFEIQNMHHEVKKIISLQDKEGREFSAKIKNRIHQRFQSHMELINTPSKKLNEQQRELKARLKKGRSILIKEFGKTRSHPTLRELLSSEAIEWIKIMTPIWMMNPSQVASYFPLKAEMFDLLLFDEATQIPLSHSLGAIHRSKRVLVVGDEHQMSPTFYFKAGEQEPIDLLHQASFSWKKKMLKHHYRSEHPELISFSNRFFYEQQLIAYPSGGEVKSAITRHFCPDAIYANRNNEKEAQALVDQLSELLKGEETIGVVAFSETQLDCILKHISPTLMLLIEERQENNTLFFKTIENVQGEECDHLLISLGYAINPEGKLLLNFGPLNRKSGRRRLNVLLTRAKKKIEFFTSINSDDLVLSQNDSLNLLRLFLLQIENPNEHENLVFPFGLLGEVSKSEEKSLVRFEHIFAHGLDAVELVTLHRVLENRKWEVQYA